MPLLTQRRWRLVGALALVACAAMAIYGPRVDARESLRAFAVYWALFAALLVIVLGAVLLDFRHIRRQYAAERREIYKETLGDEAFRRALLDAQRQSERPPRESRDGK